MFVNCLLQGRIAREIHIYVYMYMYVCIKGIHGALVYRYA